MLHKFFIRCKDSTNQVKYKVKTKFSTFKSEVSLSCLKYEKLSNHSYRTNYPGL